MEKFNINSVISILGTVLIFVFGKIDIALLLLITSVIIDYLTGIAKAYVNNNLDSNQGIKGIVKKIGYFFLVAVAVIIDRIAGDTGAIRTLVMYYFVANECLSIVENWGSMGLPIPKVLIDKLSQLKESESNGK